MLDTYALRAGYQVGQSNPQDFLYELSVSAPGELRIREEVRGSGVVGQQPLIQPGQSYQYSSGAVIETETGDMRGSYTMLTAAGERFEAPIPLFILAVPHMLH
jgi:ApaG protein